MRDKGLFERRIDSKLVNVQRKKVCDEGIKEEEEDLALGGEVEGEGDKQDQLKERRRLVGFGQSKTNNW